MKMTVVLTPELLKQIISEAVSSANNKNASDEKCKQETSFQVKPPEEFDFKEPWLWDSWIKRFNMFRNATGLSSKQETQQISMLLYSMGQEADDVLTSIGLCESERTSYEGVVKRFEAHFSSKKNIFYQRAMFIQRNQQPDEKIDSYINDLYKMAEKCEWSCKGCKSRDNFNDMVMLKLVTGVSDVKLSTSLQLQDNLTLEKVVQTLRQAENVKQQQNKLRGDDDGVLEETRKSKHPNSGRATKASSDSKTISKALFSSGMCNFCGNKGKHVNNVCPAKGQVCFKCHKIGHFGRVCRGYLKNVRQVMDDGSPNVDNEETSCDLDVLNVAQNSKLYSVAKRVGAFYVKLKLNCGPDVRFKVDTGADVSCMGLKQAKLLNLKIESTDVMLKGPGNTNLNVVGKSFVLLQKGNIYHKEEIFIIQDQNEPLLGRGGISAFELIKQIDELNISSKWFKKYPTVFSGLGQFKNPYRIKLKSDAQPYAVTCPRRIPLPLKEKVKLELEEMVRNDIITPVSEPTEWCAPLVVAPKKNGKIRLCVDFTQLNKHVQRERILLPSVDESLSQIGMSKYFSKLDTNSGFWQVVLDTESAKMTTFVTPFGRFHFKRLPFGICSAPEHFQKKMHDILSGLVGVVSLADDILVYGVTEDEHNARLEAVLEKLKLNGITLNPEKCVFNQRKVTFLGHVVDQGQLFPDPEKTKAVLGMSRPTNRSELRRFIGMINYLMKFLPHLSEKMRPLTELLSEKNEWAWTSAHSQCFERLKVEITKPEALTLYDPNLPTRVSADASMFGIGGLIEQKVGNFWKPVQYVSRTLSDVETRYAQIEKEALSLTWTCERFSSLLLGKRFELVTDHKPLVQLLGEKPLSDLSPRLQRFRMRLMAFDYIIRHESGRNFVVADALSRNPLKLTTAEQETDMFEVELFVENIISTLPVSDAKLDRIKQLLSTDAACRILRTSIETGNWDELLNTEFYKERGNLVYVDGLILKGTRIYIPQELRGDILKQIHSGHFGKTKCLSRAKETVWWPGITVDIKRMVESCQNCLEHRSNNAEPLIPSQIPNRPWEVVGVDLFEFKNKRYLVMQDYFSKYIEMITMNGITTKDIKRAYLSIFSRHGVPNAVRCDNGTPLVSKMMFEVAKEIGFSIITSSPKFPQSNGQAENAVSVCKNILKKNDDPYLGLMTHRASPLSCGYSPSELLFGRRIRTTVPVLPERLSPKWPDLSRFKQEQERLQVKNKTYFDRRHNARELNIIKPGTRVWIVDMKRYGHVVRHGETLRDYIIQTAGGNIRRNRRHLIPCKNTFISPYDIYSPKEDPKDNRPSVKARPVEGNQTDSNTDDIQRKECGTSRQNKAYTTRAGRTVQVPRKYKDFILSSERRGCNGS